VETPRSAVAPEVKEEMSVKAEETTPAVKEDLDKKLDELLNADLKIDI
jgi:hypothetical protein